MSGASARGGVLNVVRLDVPMDGATFDGLLGAASNVALRVLKVRGDGAAEPAVLWAALAAAHVYHVSSARDDLPPDLRVGAPLLARCPNLIAVTTTGVGHDTVDLAACTAAGVCAVNQVGSNSPAVAEHVFGLLLGVTRRIHELHRRLAAGERFGRHAAAGTELGGRTLGLVGIGHIGTRTARLGAAFGMRVIAYDPYVEAEEVRRRGAEPVPSLEALLAAADVVSLHCPFDAGTAGMFGAAQFAAMRPGAFFVTTARGGIHDEAALHAALVSGRLGGAGLDVWQREPPDATHPLLSLPNVVATPHIAGVTHESRRGMARMGAEQILELAGGRRPTHVLNPDAWAACERKLQRAIAC